VTFRFYRAFHNENATWLDKITAIVTLGPYSHVEMTDKFGVTIRISPRSNGIEIIKNVVYVEDRWERIEVKDKSLTELHRFIGENGQINKYDYRGAFLSVLWRCHWFCNDNKLFCSEAGAMVMGLRRPCSYSPNRLYKKIGEYNAGN